MEFQFISDPVTGKLAARFTSEHEVIGRWLETEVGDNVAMLTHVMASISEVQLGNVVEQKIIGREYHIIITPEEVQVAANSYDELNDVIPEELSDSVQGFDQQHFAECGLEDFIGVLKSWAKFS